MKAKRFRKILVISMLTIFMMMSSILSASALSLGTNWGFEEGDLTGWFTTIPSGGSVDIVETYITHPSSDLTTYDAPQGDYFALLKTDGAGSFTTISKSFTVSKGTMIEGYAFFDYQDYNPYDDKCQIVVSGDSADTVVYSKNGLGLGDHENTPWSLWTFEAPFDGTYTVTAMVSNFGDSIIDSRMGLDMKIPQVEMDVKPGDENDINLGKMGKLPVGLYGSATFDVMAIDPDSINIGGVGLYIKNNEKKMYAYEDLNQDGILDMICHFSLLELIEATVLDEFTTELILTGTLYSEYIFTTTDYVIIE